MKIPIEKILKLTFILAVFFCPARAFALMDVEAYFGYDFNGSIEGTKTDEDITGYNLGLRADYLYHVVNMVDVGIGGYTELTPLNYTISGDKYELNKFSVGIDTFARMSLPNINYHPYVRGGFALYDRSETQILNEKNIAVETFKFNSYYFGVGISYTVIPLPVIDVQVFSELLFEMSKVNDGNNIRFNRINIGVLMAI